MSQAVAHLDEMTQQNAALSEQSAASANALSGRIEQLNTLVATFKTGREPQGQTSLTATATAIPRCRRCRAVSCGTEPHLLDDAPGRRLVVFVEDHAVAPGPLRLVQRAVCVIDWVIRR